MASSVLCELFNPELTARDDFFNKNNPSIYKIFRGISKGKKY